MRRIKAAIYTFLLIVFVVALFGHNMRSIQAIDDLSRLALRIETVEEGVSSGQTSIAFDSNDYPHIVYRIKLSEGLGLRYARYNGSSWVFETVDSASEGVDVGVSFLDLDSSGYPHITYCIGGDLKYAFFDGSSWIIQIVDSTGSCERPSISIDSQGKPHLSYKQKETLKYAYNNGSSWIIQILYEGRLLHQSIAVDSHDNPHIAYTHGGGPIGQEEWANYAFYNGTSWKTTTLWKGWSARTTHIVLDSQNNPHITFRAYVMGGYVPIYYYYFDGESWHGEVPTGWQERFSNIGGSIALDSEGNPYITYIKTPWYEEAQRGVPEILRYTYYNGTSWKVEDVEIKPAEELTEPSIALDSNDHPHLSYVSLSGNGSLKYTYLKMLPSLTIDPIFYDNTGTALIQPSSWSIKFPNGTIRTVSSPVTYNLTQTGNHSIVSIIWKGTEVIPETTPTTSLTSDMVWPPSINWSPSINCRLPTSLSTSLSSSTSYFGFKVEINGNLTCNEVGLSGTPILLSYSVTGGESWNDITLVTTASDGGYSAIWMPSATGNYLVRATWSGNFIYPGTTTIINLAVTPFKEQNVFSVTSNSTVSELAFNSTSRELSFTVTGPSGTAGYVNVHIAKTLVDNIADVKVYLDGDQINYTITSIDDSWLLHFTYHHSTHTIAISLGPAPFIPPQLTTPLSLGILAIALAVATVLLIIKIRRGTPSTILNGVFSKSKQAQIAIAIRLHAPFFVDEEKDTSKMTDSEKAAFMYSEGFSMDDIGGEFKPKMHRFQVARLLRQFLKNYYKKEVTSHTE